MPVMRLIVFTLVCLFPAVGSAQAWADSYRAGDYDKAADLLHAAVSKAAGNPAFDDSQSAEALATLYARGQGTPLNPIMACSLARLAGAAPRRVSSRDISSRHSCGFREIATGRRCTRSIGTCTRFVMAGSGSTWSRREWRREQGGRNVVCPPKSRRG